MHDDNLLTAGEVANRFRVTRKTVTRWADAGKLSFVRTCGGHRRFFESEITSMLSIPTKETASDV